MDNIPPMSRLKIRHRLYISFGLIVLLVAGLVGFSQLNVRDLQSTFREYRELAKESLLLANMNQEMAKARLHAYQYRVQNNDYDRQQVVRHIANIQDFRADIDEHVKHQEDHDLLMMLSQKAGVYNESFQKAIRKQEECCVALDAMNSQTAFMKAQLSKLIIQMSENEDVEMALLASQAKSDILYASYFTRGVLTDYSESDQEQFLTAVDGAEKHLAALADMLGVEADFDTADFDAAQIEAQADKAATPQEMVKAVRAQLAGYRNNFITASEAVLARNHIYAEELDIIGPEILRAYSGLYDRVEEKQNTLGPHAESNMVSVTRANMIVGGSIALLALVLAYISGRVFTRDMLMIKKQMLRLSQGEKDIEIEGTERGDEIGMMARALEVFRHHSLEIEEMEARQRKIEERLTQERKEALVKMADEFENRLGGVIENVERSANNIEKMVTVLSQAVEDTAGQENASASELAELVKNVREVVTTADGLSLSVKNISTNMKQTLDTARKAANAA